MEKRKLESICRYRNEAVFARDAKCEEYISTESMVANRGGITLASSAPSDGKVKRYRKDDVLVSNIRPYFKKIWHASHDGACSNDVLVFEATKCDPSYLFWVLSSDAFFDYMMKTARGTKMPRGDKKAIMGYQVGLPSVDQQKAICEILESLQEKVALSNQLNGYLEELGQSLLSECLRSCGDMLPLSSVMSLGSGFAFKSSTYTNDGKFKILTIKNVQDGSVDCSNSNRIDDPPKKMRGFCNLQLGSVVLSLTGNVGRVGIVSEEDCLLNQRVAVIQPHQSSLLPGLYFYFRQKSFQNEMIGIARGTAQANLSPLETLQLEIPYDKQAFDEVNSSLLPVFDLILANKVESTKLANLRDTLLPKLMSGEIDVSKVDLKQLNSHLTDC